MPLILDPTNPGGLFRLTPPGGAKIGGHYLPGGVKVVNPHYSVLRCKRVAIGPCVECSRDTELHLAPKAFVAPNEFIPERWTTRPQLVLNKKAFCPFSLGRYACKILIRP